MRLFLLSLALFFLSFLWTPISSAATLSPTSFIQAEENASLEEPLLIRFKDIDEIDFATEGWSFVWNLGDGTEKQGIQILHTYTTPGTYPIHLEITDPEGTVYTYSHEIFIYERSFVLLTDMSSEEERIENFIQGARNQNIYIELLENFDSPSEFLAEEQFERLIFENQEILAKNDTLVIWTTSPVGLTALSQVHGSLSNTNFFQGKDIVYLSNLSFRSLENISQVVFKSINPNRIILAENQAFWFLLEVQDIDELISLLEERKIHWTLVNEEFQIKPWNFMVYFVNRMIEEGVPINTIRLVLMLPIIVTLVACAKHLIGLNTLGVYTPAILTLSFVAMDLPYGLLLFFVLFVFGTLIRLLLNRYRLLYVPRIAILLSLLSLSILLFLFIGGLLNLTSIVSIAVFPMLIMSTMAEKFVDIQTGRGFLTTLRILAEVLVVAIFAYFVVEWDFLKVTILGYPELVFLTLLVNIFLARWTGLRLLEMVRFREVIRYSEEE